MPRSSNTRQLLLYFGLMSLLVNVVNPGFLLDIPTSYMLKNNLHASASEISVFRLLTGIPFFLGFVFGLVRDLWNPLGLRDRGYFRIFIPLIICVLVWMALSRTTYLGLLVGMLLTTIAYSFVFAAFQGLTALVGLFAFSMRGGDVLGSWIYSLSPMYGFQYCVIAITVTYALILPVITFIPTHVIATADGEPNPEEETLVLSEIATAGEPS